MLEPLYLSPLSRLLLVCSQHALGTGPWLGRCMSSIKWLGIVSSVSGVIKLSRIQCDLWLTDHLVTQVIGHQSTMCHQTQAAAKIVMLSPFTEESPLFCLSVETCSLSTRTSSNPSSLSPDWPGLRALLALLALSLSFSRPELLLRALASPFWMVECQECGLDFFTLALESLLSPAARLNMLPAASPCSPLLLLLLTLLRLTLNLHGDAAQLSVLSLSLVLAPAPEFRENISISLRLHNFYTKIEISVQCGFLFLHYSCIIIIITLRCLHLHIRACTCNMDRICS